MHPKHDRTKQIFQAALDVPQAERLALVATLCGDDEALRIHVGELLDAHAAAGAFLASGSPRDAFANELERPGAYIGRYKLLERIGEGGFGVVWMAEQREPVLRRVALKVIKLGMDTKNVVARFEAERQALALMDHANIAKVFDGGATDSGRPYFVMELVRGVPITEYCDKARLSTGERLELFVAVCRAVQHAHQKGVIHRDIKPSNVLVTLQDGVAVPKVIDFGIAKATSAHLTDRTLFTECRQMIGTPEYMAPEQAEMSGLDVDTRADIYSLGVLLYELLTGTKPFDMRTLLERGWEEMMRTIREVDPQKPSTRASTLGDLGASIAAGRRVEPAQLGRIFRGDLDWIVMKAIDKDRRRRYETATAFGQDIELHLGNEPVLARPPGRGYVLGKFLRRHRVAAFAVSGITIAVVFGAAAAAYGFVSASNERDRARASETIAIAELARRTQAARFLGDMLRGVGPSVAMGRDTTILREILDTTAKRVETELASQPEVAASLLDIIGDVYRQIGSLDASEHSHRAALADWKRIASEYNHDSIGVLNNLGVVLRERGQLEESETALRTVLEYWRRTPVPSAGASNANAIALSANNLASTLIATGKKRDEAEALLREALAIWEREPGKGSSEGEGDTALALGNLGLLFQAAGDLGQAEHVTRLALDAATARFPKDHERVLTARNNLAVVLDATGHSSEARDVLSDVLDRQKRVLGEEHALTAGAYHNLAVVERRLGRLSRAEDMQRHAVEISDHLHAGDDEVRARDHAYLGRVLLESGQGRKAETEIRLALDMRRRLHPTPDASVVDSLLDLAGMYSARGDHAAEQATLEEAVHIQRAVGGTNSTALGTTLNSLGGALLAQKKPAEAAPAFREAYTILSHGRELGPDDVSSCGNNLGYALTLLGQWEEAEHVLTEILPARRNATVANIPSLQSTLQILLGAREALGKNEEARNVVREMLDNSRRELAADDPLVTDMMNWAASKLGDLGDLADGEVLAREVLERLAGAQAANAPVRATALLTLGGLLTDRSLESNDAARAAEAVRSVREALAMREKLLAPDDWRLPFTRAILGGALAANASSDTSMKDEQRLAQLVEAEGLAVAAHTGLEASKTLPAEVREARLMRVRRYVACIYEAWNRIAPSADRAAEAERWRGRAKSK